MHGTFFRDFPELVGTLIFKPEELIETESLKTRCTETLRVSYLW